MTQQDDITQRVLTDDEIEALAKKYIAPHVDRLNAILPSRVPYQQTEQFRRVKALIGDALSKLRAPVADEPLIHRCANCGAVFRGAGCPFCRLAAPVASAPVAGEAHQLAEALREWHGKGDGITTTIPDELVQALYGYLCAAPHASAEDERGHADGWAAGWNQAIKQPQADKDGGQQRAGDVDVGRLMTAAKGMTRLYSYVWDRTDDCLVVFPENVRAFDAAFDALRAATGEVLDDDTQTEQGERDA